jgi:hypothetical protein
VKNSTLFSWAYPGSQPAGWQGTSDSLIMSIHFLIFYFTRKSRDDWAIFNECRDLWFYTIKLAVLLL